MQEIYRRCGKAHILADGGVFDQVGTQLFELDHWRGRDAWLGSSGEGRGAAHFLKGEEGEYVLRHYRRGGLPGKLLDDCYLWSGLRRSRPWQEWRLLVRLREIGLPAPTPLAVQVVRSGLCYRGDIIMACVPGRPLSQLLAEGPLSPERWQAIGGTLRRFHEHGVFHADLNAHNILLDGVTVHLIDFDRGELRRLGKWRQANLARLRRSLDKLAAQRAGFAFDEVAWRQLLQGYGE